jgi:hypothetical protein
LSDVEQEEKMFYLEIHLPIAELRESQLECMERIVYDFHLQALSAIQQKL